MSDVLIVEDELGVRQFLKHVLQRADIPFRVATTGEQALKLAAANWPTVVLLDLTLPGRWDGWQVWEGLSILAGERPLRVVVFAAALTEADKVQAARRGAWGSLRKPVLPSTLIATLRQALEIETVERGWI